MKHIYNFNARPVVLFFCLAIMAIAFNSCQDDFRYELPEANSKPDTMLPMANFSYASTLEDFRTIKFTNLSAESTTYLWDFGGGNTSTEQDTTYTFPGEGTYTCLLYTSPSPRDATLSRMPSSA